MPSKPYPLHIATFILVGYCLVFFSQGLIDWHGEMHAFSLFVLLLLTLQMTFFARISGRSLRFYYSSLVISAVLLLKPIFAGLLQLNEPYPRLDIGVAVILLALLLSPSVRRYFKTPPASQSFAHFEPLFPVMEKDSGSYSADLFWRCENEMLVFPGWDGKSYRLVNLAQAEALRKTLSRQRQLYRSIPSALVLLLFLAYAWYARQSGHIDHGVGMGWLLLLYSVSSLATLRQWQFFRALRQQLPQASWILEPGQRFELYLRSVGEARQLKRRQYLSVIGTVLIAALLLFYDGSLRHVSVHSTPATAKKLSQNMKSTPVLSTRADDAAS